LQESTVLTTNYYHYHYRKYNYYHFY
jgi:hypothetical protein